MSAAPAAPVSRNVTSKGMHGGGADTGQSEHFKFVLALADDALILGHRLSEWSGKAPMLEEDIALSNLALDLIGQARLFYAYAGEIEGHGRGEDALAYLRDEHAYTNLLLVEQLNGDFAATMVRHLLYAAFVHPYFQALQKSTDTRLAEIAAKAVKEMAYHVRHASEWVIRLGDGTEESHAARRPRWTSYGCTRARCSRWTMASVRWWRNGDRRRSGGDQADVGRDHRSRAGGGNAEASAPTGGCRPAAAPAGTASTWAACWPRCR